MLNLYVGGGDLYVLWFRFLLPPLSSFLATEKSRMDWLTQAPCGLRVVRIDPLCFLARCRKRRLNQALSVLSVSVGFFVCKLFIWDTFVLTFACICMCSVALLLLVKLSVLAKWLAKTPLRKPDHGEGIVSTKPRPKSVYDFLYLVYCFSAVLLHCWLGDRKGFRPVKVGCWFVGGDHLTGVLHVL